MGHVPAPGHGVKQLGGGVLGLGGHEPDQIVPLDFVQLPQEVGKVPRRLQILAVGVDVLPQQSDLLIPLGGQLPHVIDDALRLPAALPAPDVGDDTV